ncbi:MAG: 3-deoxy-7-phosphoheptulonate synthase [Burkholderiales bacterium]|nr:MAG: 3-deoxy-7-phosphoheptulonate synthase [Burkholderiales bacterium]
MPYTTDDLRIRAILELAPPAHLIREFPCTEKAGRTTFEARQAIHRILHGMDDRLLAVVGPCSIHDPVAALEYARMLSEQRLRHADALEIVMRVYFEKPRTTVGWKGLINDPDLDGSFNINKGLRSARELLLNINELGLPAGSEYLDMITPQYVADMISWGAIGARTTESQVHRELASGLSCPVGFKNGTDGNVRIAFDAIKAASQPHHFLSVTKGGHSAIVATNGNEDCHIILRGGRQPNYDSASVEAACAEAGRCGVACRLMIDASHGNSQKNHDNQLKVLAAIGDQLRAGESRIFGVMIESHLIAGRQDLVPDRTLVHGQSITDACLGWEQTVQGLEGLAEAVRERRLVLSQSQ